MKNNKQSNQQNVKDNHDTNSKSDEETESEEIDLSRTIPVGHDNVNEKKKVMEKDEVTNKNQIQKDEFKLLCEGCKKVLDISKIGFCLQCNECNHRYCRECIRNARVNVRDGTKRCAGCNISSGGMVGDSYFICNNCVKINPCNGNCQKWFCFSCTKPCVNQGCVVRFCSSCTKGFQSPCSQCNEQICKICMLSSICSGSCGKATCEACAPNFCGAECGLRICNQCGYKCTTAQHCGDKVFCGNCVLSCRGDCGNKLCLKCSHKCHSCGENICTSCADDLMCHGTKCKRIFCVSCIALRCKECTKKHCFDCLSKCHNCDELVCIETSCSDICAGNDCMKRICTPCSKINHNSNSCKQCHKSFCSSCVKKKTMRCCNGPCQRTELCDSCVSSCQSNECKSSFCIDCCQGGQLNYSCYTCEISSLCQSCAHQDHASVEVHNCFTIVPLNHSNYNKFISNLTQKENEHSNTNEKCMLPKDDNIIAIVYADKSKYLGEMKDTVPHGRGVWSVPSAMADTTNCEKESIPEHAIIQYNGEWNFGVHQGQGRAIYANGRIYEGQWYQNNRHGAGKLWDGKSMIYDGEWLNGMKNGYGIFETPNKAIYKGKWKDDKKHGQGTFSDGSSKYVGEWENDMRCGIGTQYYPNLTIYIGEWQDDVQHGRGELREQDEGVTLEGNWNKGKRTGTFIFKWLDGIKTLQYYRYDLLIAERSDGLSENVLSAIKLQKQLSKEREIKQKLEKYVTSLTNDKKKIIREMNLANLRLNEARSEMMLKDNEITKQEEMILRIEKKKSESRKDYCF